jgi:hypothetical protein
MHTLIEEMGDCPEVPRQAMTGSKSSKQRAAELKARRVARSAKRAQRMRDDLYAFRIGANPSLGTAPVNAALLAPDGSYGVPGFVKCGYYSDSRFQCQDCEKQEVWTATQQKWWYEIAKGGVWTRALRCRPCRRRERERVTEQRRVSDEGKQRKAQLKAAGK